MFERPHHRRVAQVLESMDARFLSETCSFFAGGTAIALRLNEFRESLDVDFACSDPQGYRQLRSAVFHHGLDALFTSPVEALRELRADHYGVRVVLRVDDAPVKVEIVREARMTLEAEAVPGIPVLSATREGLFAAKLLANADRYADDSALARDIIDLTMMEARWGEVPKAAWAQATAAYGDAAVAAYDRARQRLRTTPVRLAACLQDLAVEPWAASEIKQRLLAGARDGPEPVP